MLTLMPTQLASRVRRPNSMWARIGVRATVLSAVLVGATPGQANQQSWALIGQGQFSFWGFSVYTASLWAGAEFESEQWRQAPLRLRLQYQRQLSAKDITERSLQEMARAAPLQSTQTRAWRQYLLRCLRDVNAGDTLSATHDGLGAIRFTHNDQATCRIEDADFARRFLGIWLAARTSAPALRLTLLGLTRDDD